MHKLVSVSSATIATSATSTTITSIPSMMIALASKMASGQNSSLGLIGSQIPGDITVVDTEEDGLEVVGLQK